MSNPVAVLTLRASAQKTTATTENGTSVLLNHSFRHGIAILDVTDIGDLAEASDTLDVYLDAAPEDDTVLDASKTWFNIGRFTQVAGTTGTPATGTLTLTGAIVPGSHAVSVLTSDATNVADGETVTIGSTVYRFKDTMAQAYDVKRGVDAATSLDNLKAAINASGTPGVEYFAGTVAHPSVVATTNTDTQQTIVARVPGTAANTLATTETSGHLSWPDTTLGGGTGASNPGVAPQTVTVGAITYSFVDVLSETNGAAAIAYQVLFGADSAAALDNLKSATNGTAGAGTTYSTGTVAHTQVTATTNTDTSQVFQAVGNSTSYNSVATTETLTNGAFAGATLSGGTPGVASDVRQVIVYDDSQIEASPPNSVLADLGSPGRRNLGFMRSVRCRSVGAGSNVDFTFAVKLVLSE